MAIVVETGSNVTGANSYCTFEEMRSYATSRGVTLPSNDGVLQVLSTKAIDYMESKRGRYLGVKTNSDQSLQFPRTGLYIDGIEIEEDVIPQIVKDLQCRLIMELSSGVDLLPTTLPTGFVVEETVGPIKTRYSEKIRNGTLAKMKAVDALFAPIIISGGGLYAGRG